MIVSWTDSIPLPSGDEPARVSATLADGIADLLTTSGVWEVPVFAVLVMAHPTMLPMTMMRIVSTRPRPSTIPRAPRAQLIGAMLAPAQIQN